MLILKSFHLANRNVFLLRLIFTLSSAQDFENMPSSIPTRRQKLVSFWNGQVAKPIRSLGIGGQFAIKLTRDRSTGLPQRPAFCLSTSVRVQFLSRSETADSTGFRIAQPEPWPHLVAVPGPDSGLPGPRTSGLVGANAGEIAGKRQATCRFVGWASVAVP